MTEKIILTKEILEKGYDELTYEEEVKVDKVLTDMFRYDMDYALYHNHIDLPVVDTDGLTVNIERICDYDYRDVDLSYDFAFDYGVLLSLATGLDYVCYNSDIELWNTICINDDYLNHRNVMDIYSESIYLLFQDIEYEIYKTCDLLSDDDIWDFINEYDYIHLIDTSELFNYISCAMNELDTKIDDAVKNFFEIELYDMYVDSQFDLSECLYEQLDDDGIVEYVI